MGSQKDCGKSKLFYCLGGENGMHIFQSSLNEACLIAGRMTMLLMLCIMSDKYFLCRCMLDNV